MLRAIALFGALLCTALPAYAVKYSVTILQPPGYAYSAALANTNSNQVGYGALGTINHALLWSGTAASAVDLTPLGYSASNAYSTSGAREAGDATPTGGTNSHAMLWNSTAASAVDLNPPGFSSSSATGVSSLTQVGYGTAASTGNHTHALLWSGSAASAIDLNPAGFTDSRAAGATSTNQIGQATNASNQTHAVLWSGTSTSAVDLEPANYGNTYGTAVSGNNQVGYGSPPSSANVHALLWQGTAASVVDLHPTGWMTSFANAISGTTEVGSASMISGSFTTHAFLWTGTAASALDLHQFVTAQYGSTYVNSEANGVTTNGTIVGRLQDASFNSYAVLWKPETGIPGDYNNDGIVNMADYVYWRSGTTNLFNEVSTLGANTADDYTAWRARFGKISGSGAGGLRNVAIPEPFASGLILVALTFVSTIRRLRDH